MGVWGVNSCLTLTKHKLSLRSIIELNVKTKTNAPIRKARFFQRGQKKALILKDKSVKLDHESRKHFPVKGCY